MVFQKRRHVFFCNWCVCSILLIISTAHHSFFLQAFITFINDLFTWNFCDSLHAYTLSGTVFCHHDIVSLYRMYTYTDVISWERKSFKLRHIGRNVSKDFIRSPIPFDGIQCFVLVKVECTIEDRITTSYYCFRDMNTKVL